MTGLLEGLEEIHSTTPYNRWNKDAQLLYMWNSLHGVWQHSGMRLRELFDDAKRHDFVPLYVMRHAARSRPKSHYLSRSLNA